MPHFTPLCSMSQYTLPCRMSQFTLPCNMSQFTLLCKMSQFTLLCDMSHFTLLWSMSQFTLLCRGAHQFWLRNNQLCRSECRASGQDMDPWLVLRDMGPWLDTSHLNTGPRPPAGPLPLDDGTPTARRWDPYRSPTGPPPALQPRSWYSLYLCTERHLVSGAHARTLSC